MIKLKALLMESFTEVSFTGTNVGAKGDEVYIQYDENFNPIRASVYKTSPLVKFNPNDWELYDAEELAKYKWPWKQNSSLMLKLDRSLPSFIWWIKELGYVEHRDEAAEPGEIKELMSPYATATEQDTRRGYIGVVTGRVEAYDELVPDVLGIDHSELPRGRSGTRFRYFLKSPPNTVLWNEFPPAETDKHKVEDWLAKRGVTHPKHIGYREYFYLTTGKWE
jgi:hypothetical protein